ncbi:hypothetical protein DKX38_022986 [Salix brachista]|uniref:Uncharacterized protein n=1 Tax=Salix brachista TaxID=2182728 RepID=A0A5N5KC21_9ROSI|nr:hypothetical protein DKX38_022986 [Salix brachista]
MQFMLVFLLAVTLEGKAIVLLLSFNRIGSDHKQKRECQRLEDKDLREQLASLETLSEELIDRTVSTFLQQVEDDTYTSGGWPQVNTDYSVSKLAVNAYTRLMAMKLSDRPNGQKIYINCYCPGWVKTAMTGWAGNVSAEDGADTGVWLALLPDQAITGKFFAERREVKKMLNPVETREALFIFCLFPQKRVINKMASLRRALVNVNRILNSTTTPKHISATSPLRSQHGLFSRYSTLNNNDNKNPSLDIDLSNEESKRRICNRLLYRSRQRGILELDLVLGKWVEEHIYSLDENGVKALIDVLDLACAEPKDLQQKYLIYALLIQLKILASGDKFYNKSCGKIPTVCPQCLIVVSSYLPSRVFSTNYGNAKREYARGFTLTCYLMKAGHNCMENPDLWKWLTGQEQPPETLSINPVFSAVRDKIMNNLSSHAAPETRAIPGQPWVRGWDDIKKSAGGPVAGNQ